MSQPDFDRALERMATDPAFAAAVRSNQAGALAGYDLTDTERQGLAGMQTAAPAATPAPAALATRRSKSSILGIGAVAGVAVVGATTLGVIHVLSPTSGYSEYMRLNSGAEGGVYSINRTVDTSGAGIGSGGTIRSGSVTFTVVRPEDSFSQQLAEDAARGTVLNTVTFRFQSGGKDVEHITLSHVLITSVEVSSSTGSDGLHPETVKLAAETVQISYP